MHMNAMRPVSTTILVGMWLVGIAACSPAILMSTPASKTAEGWSITLSQVKDGPDEYIGEGGILVAPADSQTLIWAVMTFRNDSGQEQEFSYDSCVISGPGEAFKPLVIDRHADPEVNSPADKAETYDPGQERTRQLVFPYPKDKRPKTIKCETVAFPIQGPR
jgi:hypothetical protein